MTQLEYEEIRHRVNKLIAFIKWNAPFETKQKKVIKELTLISEFGFKCVSKENPDSLEKMTTVDQ